MTSYQSGFLSRCRSFGIPERLANSLLKEAEGGDPNLQRATEIFKDWLTTRRHTVRSGEVLSGIARKYNVPLQDVMRENGISSTTGIRPGQSIRIPTVDRKASK